MKKFRKHIALSSEDVEDLKLRQEARKCVPEIIALRPIERAVRTNAMRRTMKLKGRALTERDEYFLRGYEHGALLFEELADHFYERAYPR
jgi:hypothetical protein